jgi:uncharacterized FlaG/YvyC family protein
MSLDIGSVGGPYAATAVQATAKAKTIDPALRTDATEAVKVDVGSSVPDSPPPEVLDAMGVASNMHDQLAASDRGISFKIDDATGKVVVTVHDTHGKVLFTLPGKQALDIASGQSLPE